MKHFNVMGDVDDVFFPLAQGMHDRCHMAGLHDGTKPWTQWNMWLDYEVEKEVWIDTVGSLALDGYYDTAEPIPGSVEAWRRLHWEGHGLHMVTARGFLSNAEVIREATPKWFAEWGLPYDTLTFSKDKVAAQAELGINFDFAIDDGVHNYEALDNAGIRVYLLTQPHNQDFDAERRVDTVGEFVDIIIEEAHRG